MEARITGFKGTKRVRRTNYAIIKAEEDLGKLIGQEVTWTSPGGKMIRGTIQKVHGKDSLMAKFTRGLPGDARGTNVVIGKLAKKAVKKAETKAAPKKKAPAKKTEVKEAPAKKAAPKKKAPAKTKTTPKKAPAKKTAAKKPAAKKSTAKKSTKKEA